MNGNDPKRFKLCSATSSHSMEGWRMRYVRRIPSYGECITELAQSHFHQWRKYFHRHKSSLGLLLSLQAVVIFMGILREIVHFSLHGFSWCN